MSSYQPDVKFIDASEWMEQPWFSTGGTRAKRVLLSPKDEHWYFKCSEKKPATDSKPEKYYKYEFWSEVIAYQLGTAAGLNVLRYDVAVHNEGIGCISPQMNKTDKEQLIEIGRFMTALSPDFFPEDNKTRVEYTFQLIEETIDHFGLEQYWPHFMETMLFDAIIGNTDRHQENWAFLGENTLVVKTLNEIEGQAKRHSFQKLNWFIRWLYKRMFNLKTNTFNKEGNMVRLALTNILQMAPIYDSGSSMGRELSEERVSQLLNDEKALSDYVERGKSEIHWEKEKISHFSFIENLIKSSYCDDLIRASSFIDKLDANLLQTIVNEADREVPAQWADYRIPPERKELMSKLLSLRVTRLKKIIDEHRV